MAFTAADVIAVETLISTRITGGAVRSLSIGGKRVDNEPLSELYKLLALMREEVHGSTSRTTKADLRYTRS